MILLKHIYWPLMPHPPSGMAIRKKNRRILIPDTWFCRFLGLQIRILQIPIWNPFIKTLKQTGIISCFAFRVLNPSPPFLKKEWVYVFSLFYDAYCRLGYFDLRLDLPRRVRIGTRRRNKYVMLRWGKQYGKFNSTTHISTNFILRN